MTKGTKEKRRLRERQENRSPAVALALDEVHYRLCMTLDKH